jgi:hypothetical protein
MILGLALCIVFSFTIALEKSSIKREQCLRKSNEERMKGEYILKRDTVGCFGGGLMDPRRRTTGASLCARHLSRHGPH